MKVGQGIRKSGGRRALVPLALSFAVIFAFGGVAASATTTSARHEPSGQVTGATPKVAKSCTNPTPISYATQSTASNPLFTYWTVAQYMGYFKAACVTSTIITDIAGLQSVEAGKVTFTVSGQDSVLQLAAAAPGGSVPVKAFYEQVPRPYYSVAVLASSPIKTFAQLAGQTVATLSASFTGNTVLRTAVTAEGGDASTVTLVPVPEAAAAAELQSGQVAALNYVDNYTVFFNQQLGVKLRVLPLPKALQAISSAMWVASTSFINTNKAALTGYITAYLKGWEFVQTQPQKAAQIVVDLYPVNRLAGQTCAQAVANVQEQVMARNADTQLPPVSAKWATPRLLGWSYPFQWGVMQNLIPATQVVASVPSLYTNQFIKAAWANINVKNIGIQAKRVKIPAC